MDAAAQHDRIVRVAAAPALGELVQAPVVVVGLGVVDTTHPSVRDLLAQRAEAGRHAQDRVGREPQARTARQRLANGAGLALGDTHRLLAEDVPAGLERTEDVSGVILVVARDRDDGDVLVADQVLGAPWQRTPG